MVKKHSLVKLVHHLATTEYRSTVECIWDMIRAHSFEIFMALAKPAIEITEISIGCFQIRNSTKGQGGNFDKQDFDELHGSI